MKAMGVVALLAISSVALAQGARGPYHDRADEEAALKRLSPQEELRVRAWAAEHPEAARRLRGRVDRSAQESILDELDKVSPEEKDEKDDDGKVNELIVK
jgi:hypothetical protein